MDIDEAQELLAAVGSDNAPTAEQLSESRAAFVEAARVAKGKGDRTALAAMLEAIKVADRAIDEAKEAQTKEAEELSALVQDFPELSDAPADEAGATDAPATEKKEEAPAMLSVAEAAQRLGLGKRTASAEVNEPEPSQTLTINGEDATNATWANLGDSFAKASKSSLRGGRTTLATFKTEYTNTLTEKGANANSRVLDTLARRAGEEAVIAAGGCCSLAEPIRDQPMLASLARPIASALPTVGASAGKVSMFGPVCLPQGGVGTWTCADDEAVDPGDEGTWKECDTVECDTPIEVDVDAIYKCLTIGNFQQRFAGERWEAVLHAAAAAQARMAEVALFEGIATSPQTTTHTAIDTGSVYANTIRALVLAWSTIRQNQRYEGLRARAILPDWVQDAAALDATARAINRGRTIDADLEVVLARHGIDVIWSPDIDPIEPDGQVDATPLTEYPEDFTAVIFVDGGAFRIDGGELNLGTEVRDHDLNRQNSVAAFSESFEASVVRSCDTKAITIPAPVCSLTECPEPAAP